MTRDSRLLETQIGSPPADPTPVSQQGLPEDLLREAAQRLAFTALISGGLWLANWLVVQLVHPLPGTVRPKDIALHARYARVFDWVGGAAFLASLALFWYTRRSRRSPRFLFDLALVYEVFIALNIGVLNYACHTSKTASLSGRQESLAMLKTLSVSASIAPCFTVPSLGSLRMSERASFSST